jgi:hypothetical protein
MLRSSRLAPNRILVEDLTSSVLEVPGSGLEVLERRYVMPDPAATTDAQEGFACSLSPAEMLDRLVGWRALAGEALSRRSEPGRVVSVYPRRHDIAARLEELIEAETQCCPFLVFAVRETEQVIEAELRYPPEFQPIVAMIAPA